MQYRLTIVEEHMRISKLLAHLQNLITLGRQRPMYLTLLMAHQYLPEALYGTHTTPNTHTNIHVHVYKHTYVYMVRTKIAHHKNDQTKTEGKLQ